MNEMVRHDDHHYNNTRHARILNRDQFHMNKRQRQFSRSPGPSKASRVDLRKHTDHNQTTLHYQKWPTTNSSKYNTPILGSSSTSCSPNPTAPISEQPSIEIEDAISPITRLISQKDTTIAKLQSSNESKAQSLRTLEERNKWLHKRAIELQNEIERISADNNATEENISHTHQKNNQNEQIEELQACSERQTRSLQAKDEEIVELRACLQREAKDVRWRAEEVIDLQAQVMRQGREIKGLRRFAAVPSLDGKAGYRARHGVSRRRHASVACLDC